MLNGTRLNSAAINGSSSQRQYFAEFKVVSTAELAVHANLQSSIDWDITSAAEVVASVVHHSSVDWDIVSATELTAYTNRYSSIDWSVVSAAEVAATTVLQTTIDWSVVGRFLIENISAQDLASANWDISSTSDLAISVVFKYLDAELTLSSTAEFIAVRNVLTSAAWSGIASTDLEISRILLAAMDAWVLNGGEFELSTYSGVVAPVYRRFYTEPALDVDRRVFTSDPAANMARREFTTDPAANMSRRVFITDPAADAEITLKAA